MLRHHAGASSGGTRRASHGSLLRSASAFRRRPRRNRASSRSAIHPTAFLGNLLAVGVALFTSAPALAQRHAETSATEVTEAERERAARSVREGRGQRIDVDGDGDDELFMVDEHAEVQLYRGRTRQRIGVAPFTEAEVTALSLGGIAVVVVMTGGAHVVRYDHWAVRVRADGATVVGHLGVDNAMSRVSLANLDADPEPEIVMVIAPEGEIANAQVRVFDLRGDRMHPMPNSRAARRAFVAPVRADALRGRQPALQRALSVHPEDWPIQLAEARRRIAGAGDPTEPAMWTVAHAPPARRTALREELSLYLQWPSWPYGLVLESFPCAPVRRWMPADPLFRWTIESRCLHEVGPGR